jgi:methionyl aminopeptidase
VIIRKSPAEIDKMAAAGDVLVRCTAAARQGPPGVTTEELDAAAEKFIRSQGAVPSFKGYRGFPGLDLRLAEPHGRARASRVRTSSRKGDVLSIDIGVTLDGWVADARGPTRSAR